MIDFFERFGNLKFGFFNQYFTTIIGLNPFLFIAFHKEEWILLLLGLLLSIWNVRALFPFILLIVLILDVDKLDRDMLIASVITFVGFQLLYFFSVEGV